MGATASAEKQRGRTGRSRCRGPGRDLDARLDHARQPARPPVLGDPQRAADRQRERKRDADHRQQKGAEQRVQKAARAGLAGAPPWEAETAGQVAGTRCRDSPCRSRSPRRSRTARARRPTHRRAPVGLPSARSRATSACRARPPTDRRPACPSLADRGRTCSSVGLVLAQRELDQIAEHRQREAEKSSSRANA